MDFQLLSAALAIPSRLTQSSYWHGHIPFAHYIVATQRPSLIVEFGVEHGDSLFAFADAVRWNEVECEIVGCDLWKGDSHVGRQFNWIYERITDMAADYGGQIKLIREDTAKAAVKFRDKSVDLLHIDASHKYDEVRADFEAMRHKLSNRAIVLFHDTTVFSKKFGVWKFWEELREQFPHIDFVHSCGLGVLLTGNDPDLLIRQIFEMSDDQKLAMARLFSALGKNISLQYDTNEQRNAIAKFAQIPPPPEFKPDALLTRCIETARW